MNVTVYLLSAHVITTNESHPLFIDLVNLYLQYFVTCPFSLTIICSTCVPRPNILDWLVSQSYVFKILCASSLNTVDLNYFNNIFLDFRRN